MAPSQSSQDPDLESNNRHAFLVNNAVRDFAWKDVTVTVKDRETKKAKVILSGASGHVGQGKISLASSVKWAHRPNDQ